MKNSESIIKRVFNNPSKWRAVLKYSLFIMLGIAMGWAGEYLSYSDDINSVLKDRQLRLGQQSSYPFINPLIACDISDQNLFKEYSKLKEKVDSFINESIDQNKISRASLYFRDINRGEWAGINENENYIPASLVKLPLMISYYKYAATHPDIFDKTLIYNGENTETLRQVIAPPPNKLQKGHSYSIKELLSRMIIYSDNNAYLALSAIIDPRVRQEVYSDLGFDFGPTGPINNSVSVKSFSIFLRILYNSSYLDRKPSNEILQKLTQTTFKDGLVAGVPDSVAVAHKFGERTLLKNGALEYRELHDCGIVYLPSKPYLLCIMTQGKDFNALKEVIHGLSSLVYNEVSRVLVSN